MSLKFTVAFGFRNMICNLVNWTGHIKRRKEKIRKVYSAQIILKLFPWCEVASTAEYVPFCKVGFNIV